MRIARLTGMMAWSVLAILLGLAPAAAEKRVALVIGNGDYQKVSKLPNPMNDAKAIAGMLQYAGFDAVELHENLGIRELRRAIGDFSDAARDADMAIVYYSGHGMEVNGVNYLIPVDAVLERDVDVPYEAFSLDNLLQVLEPVKRLRLVMLDACRDNPFTRSMKRTVGTRAVGRGLAAIEPTSVNTLVGFAAKAGSYALDGEGSNSPYATAVLNHVATPGLDLRIAFGRVRDDVMKNTKNKQEPFTYGSLGGANISIVDAPATSDAGPTGSTSAPVLPLDRAAQAWAATKDTASVAIIADFIRQFGTTPYGSMARARLEELKKDQVAVEEAKRRRAAELEAENRRTAELEAAKRRVAELEAANRHTAELEVAKRHAAELDAANRRTAELEAENRRAAEREAENRRAAEADLRKQTAALAEQVRRSDEAKRVTALEDSRVAALPPPPDPRYRYGAIAISQEKMAWGTGHNYRSQKEAEERALLGCRKHSGDCKIVQSIWNGCQALATGKGGWGTGSSANIDTARELALNNCNKVGQNCAVATSSCSKL
jgi:uncharacterized caspase-like protein